MKVFLHHIYEYKKGLRNLVLHTVHSSFRNTVERILRSKKIDYIIREVNPNKINVFFGDLRCINVIKTFGNKPLNLLTDEEDFILGILLGYCRTLQCSRYLSRKKINQLEKSIHEPVTQIR